MAQLIIDRGRKPGEIRKGMMGKKMISPIVWPIPFHGMAEKKKA